MTLISRISGLVRDVAFANLLGDKAAADIFLVAFRLPNFFRRLSAEGAFSAAFVPVFTEFRETRSMDDNRAFLALTSGRFALALALICGLGVWMAPWLVTAIAPGFLQDPDKFELTVETARIAFPYLFFVSLVAMSAGMLNTCGRFAVPAATPVLLNLCLIVAAIWLAPYFADAPVALAIGVIAAGVLQLGVQLPFLAREGLMTRPRLRAGSNDQLADQGSKKVFKLMVPALFGVSVAQINVLVNTLLASFMVTGSISWLYYSDRLMEFPVGVFGIALATVILPNLSKKHTLKSSDAFGSTLDWACRWVFLVCIPATAGLILLAEAMIVTIYFHGDFSELGVRMSTNSLIAFSLGLTAIVLVKVLATGFFARQDTRTPVRIGAIAVAVNIVVSLLLFRTMHHVGLAFATSVAAVVNAVLLYSKLAESGVVHFREGWFRFLLKVGLATGAMCAFLFSFRGETIDWYIGSVFWRVGVLSALILIAALIYFVTLYLLGIRFRELMQAPEGNR